jgi:hypothetical protein
MTKSKLIACAGLLALVLMVPQVSHAQLSVGIIGGADLEPDGTMVGLAANMTIMMVNVGLHAEFGEATEEVEACVGTQLPNCELTFDVIRFMVPVSFPIAVGESGLMLFPFVAPGVYSWSCENCDSASEFSLDAGVRGEYNIFMAAASYGFQDLTPDWTFRVGFLFTIGS